MSDTAVGAAPPDPDDNDDLDFLVPEKGSAEELLDANAQGPLDAMRHSSAHVMAEAVMDLFPGTKLGIGPAIKDGFYYDFDLPRALVPEDLAAIEARMRESIAADHPFVRKEWDPDEGRAFLEQQGQSYKVEILDDLRTAARLLRIDRRRSCRPISKARSSTCVADRMSRRPARSGRSSCCPSPAPTGAARRSDRCSSASTAPRGTPRRSSTSTCGAARRRASATIAGWVSRSTCSASTTSARARPSGTPRASGSGAPSRRAMREVQDRRGYQEISTPILVHKKLWEQSGHWDMYGDNMFRVESEGQTFSLKPMNCPESTFIYKTRVRSYRDLPLRFNEYGRLHRNERSGALSGLTRVRHFIQDDAHIFVRPDQLSGEIQALLGEVAEAYSWFGLVPRFAFATRPDKALGDPEAWARAEGLIKEALDTAGVSYVVKPKDGTFYAPKIDIYIDDALGREWQMATIQVDLMMLPERFDLHYIDEQGQPQRPLAIHRAIYGSLERFIGILVEHFAGAFPFWCAPVQAVVVPIADRHNEAAGELAAVLRSRGIRVEVDDSSNRMQNKIRVAQEQKVPYMLVLGDREIEARTAAARTRAGEQQPALDWEMLADRLATEAADRRPA